MGDRGSVRGAQATLGGEAAAESADHRRPGHGARHDDRADADCRSGSPGGAARAQVRHRGRRSPTDRCPWLRGEPAGEPAVVVGGLLKPSHAHTRIVLYENLFRAFVSSWRLMAWVMDVPSC